jgi:hypothetical protein
MSKPAQILAHERRRGSFWVGRIHSLSLVIVEDRRTDSMLPSASGRDVVLSCADYGVGLEEHTYTLEFSYSWQMPPGLFLRCGWAGWHDVQASQMAMQLCICRC